MRANELENCKNWQPGTTELLQCEPTSWRTARTGNRGLLNCSNAVLNSSNASQRAGELQELATGDC
ncbi:hypothetical protein [Flavobacterium davisii]|uniref:Uncharacterized protein n=1 Tax=Flavobacterium columnare TaxID=996 RepID=A0A8G0P6N4_9FLAO|nr:hypothetical protein [Flavobacterium davisii]QYS88034.1 hypothetical protein JJC05_09140 [Flavobacterium davisii]